MRPTLLLAAALATFAASGSSAQLAPAWGDGMKMTHVATEIATAQLVIEMCQLDAKQVVDDGNTVFELLKELHPISYKRGRDRARADFAKARQTPEATCERAVERLPWTQKYFANLAEQARPMLAK